MGILILMTNTNNTSRILFNHSGSGWEHGRFGVERKCDCRRGNRSAECFSAGWHLVASSDDLGDALAGARSLEGHGTYRVVDQDDYSEVAA